MGDTVWLGAAIGAAIVVYILMLSFRPNKLKAAVAQARESGELQPILDTIGAMSASRKATAWNQAIDALWKAYERELAARLVHEAAREHGAEDVIQYWIRHVLEVEPEIARKVFPKKFITQFVKTLQAQAESQPGAPNS